MPTLAMRVIAVNFNFLWLPIFAHASFKATHRERLSPRFFWDTQED